MQITNVHELPEALVRALTYDDYDYAEAGDISVTGLIQPVRIRQLTKRYQAEIVEDASDLIWRLIGNIGHKIVERGAPENTFSEERLKLGMHRWTITGKVDLMRTAVKNIDGWNTDEYAIEDFKFRSVWAAKDIKPEDEKQLNLYALIARHNRFNVTELRIVSVLRDWSKLRATREPDYPRAGVTVREIPLWPVDRQEAFMSERVHAHQAGETLADDDLPICTPEERWAKPDTWAVKKRGNKRALRVLESADDADAYIAGSAASYPLEIEHRVGQDVRCLNYCAVKNMCSYGRSLSDAIVDS